MKRFGVVVAFLTLILAGCVANHGVFHEVVPGDTLTEIGRCYDIDWAYLAEVNGIEKPANIIVGDKLFIPGAYRHKLVQYSKKSLAVKESVFTSEETKEEVRPKVKKKPVVVKKTKTAPSSVDEGFTWPLRGDVVKSFGETKGALCRGIEIKARVGVQVKASSPGKVIYAGDGISGYGNLVIIQHADKWFTVYGYNSKILVAAGDFVSRGDTLAVTGKSPDGREGILHFEMRNGHDPVDPEKYLRQ